MYKLVIIYTDKSSETKYFKTWEECDWYLHMGGDHVLDYTISKKKIMANGEGCMCAARYAGECACDDVDWNPPKKEFIGLTDDEIKEIWLKLPQFPNHFDISRAIEAKLKEKNHG
jgi:hypothetical protein